MGCCCCCQKRHRDHSESDSWSQTTTSTSRDDNGDSQSCEDDASYRGNPIDEDDKSSSSSFTETDTFSDDHQTNSTQSQSEDGVGTARALHFAPNSSPLLRREQTQNHHEPYGDEKGDSSDSSDDNLELECSSSSMASSAAERHADELERRRSLRLNSPAHRSDEGSVLSTASSSQLNSDDSEDVEDTHIQNPNPTSGATCNMSAALGSGPATNLDCLRTSEDAVNYCEEVAAIISNKEVNRKFFSGADASARLRRHNPFASSYESCDETQRTASCSYPNTATTAMITMSEAALHNDPESTTLPTLESSLLKLPTRRRGLWKSKSANEVQTSRRMGSGIWCEVLSPLGAEDTDIAEEQKMPSLVPAQIILVLLRDGVGERSVTSCFLSLCQEAGIELQAREKANELPIAAASRGPCSKNCPADADGEVFSRLCVGVVDRRCVETIKEIRTIVVALNRSSSARFSCDTAPSCAPSLTMVLEARDAVAGSTSIVLGALCVICTGDLPNSNG